MVDKVVGISDADTMTILGADSVSHKVGLVEIDAPKKASLVIVEKDRVHEPCIDLRFAQSGSWIAAQSEFLVSRIRVLVVTDHARKILGFVTEYLKNTILSGITFDEYDRLQKEDLWKKNLHLSSFLKTSSQTQRGYYQEATLFLKMAKKFTGT